MHVTVPLSPAQMQISPYVQSARTVTHAILRLLVEITRTRKLAAARCRGAILLIGPMTCLTFTYRAKGLMVAGTRSRALCVTIHTSRERGNPRTVVPVNT